MRILTFLLTLCVCAPAFAQSPAIEAEQPRIEYGFEHRTRFENFGNTQDLDAAAEDLRSHFRFRTKLWAELHATRKLNFFLRLDNEFRKTFAPETSFSRSAPDETIVESLYVELKNLRGLSARVGRQDIQKGEGFVLGEGTSGDGSRSFYFNAAILEYAWRKSKIEVIGALQPRTDRFLPRLNNRDKALSEYAESMLGAYYTNAERKHTDFEAYYLLKKETGDTRAATAAAFLPDRDVHTAGTRMVRRFDRRWKAAGEFAYQWGAQHANPARLARAATISGVGGYGYVRKDFNAAWKPYLSAGYWAVSGDDATTPETYEGWDPVFSRQPQRSDLYAYAFQKERGAGYWTNLRMPFVQAGFAPVKQLNVTSSLYYVDAFHPYNGSPAMFGTGTHRGELVTLKGEFKLNDAWKGHVQYEHLAPGSFYAKRDGAHFFRAEILYSFKSGWGRAAAN